MAQAMASMAGLRGSSQKVLEGSLQRSGGSRFEGPASLRVAGCGRAGLSVIKSQGLPAETEAQSGRRAMLGLFTAGVSGVAFVNRVLAEPKLIKIGPPPAPSGGLRRFLCFISGTLNSDEARDLDLPIKERFFIQPLPPAEAAQRAKESAKDILNVKELIDKKQWPYVKNDLRLKAQYLRYDLNTVISAKPKEEKKALKQLTSKLFSTIDDLDHAAKIKSSTEAEKYYAETKSQLDDLIAKLG
ncbi:Oxygen-evolving enhancer protein 3-2, chloroplastic [Dendrobium catenatum]|uniref:Oxygen-evolving enhancer protein 3-2, chloroplastic n=1 Tax=Dendrobium catenatum TaxID=906689 RepID=A0A2I0VH38_9ASPA|nr:Oxygen-evolving enhancer protein 3-2, chloroplastic [Dendrobium catenatum]